MINDNFDRVTRMNMEIALDNATKCLPDGYDVHEYRREIAAGIMACVKAGHTHLDELIRAADIAAARMINDKMTA